MTETCTSPSPTLDFPRNCVADGPYAAPRVDTILAFSKAEAAVVLEAAAANSVSNVSVDLERFGFRPPAPLPSRKMCFQEGDVGEGSEAAADAWWSAALER